jgi:hypothetical protein
VSCTQCSRAFTRRDCLLRHLRTKHRLAHNEALLVTKLLCLIFEYLKVNVFIFQTIQDMTRNGTFDPSRTYDMDHSGDGCNSSTLSAPELPSPESNGLERLEGLCFFIFLFTFRTLLNFVNFSNREHNRAIELIGRIECPAQFWLARMQC